MMHVAIHDALNAIDRRSQSLRLQRTRNRCQEHRPMPPSPPPRVDVLVPLLEAAPSALLGVRAPQRASTSVEDDYAAALAAIPDGRAKDQRRSARAGRRRGHPRR